MDHFLHTLPSRQPTLRELEIRNLDPTRSLWTIMAAPALVHLSALHWNIAISEYTPLLVQVCTLIDMLERTCPRLAVLSLSCIQGPFSSPADDEQSHDSLTPESFLVGDHDNCLSISPRTRSAITCTETCKLNMLRHLSLDGFTGILDWTIRFFGPALSRVTELELEITCLSIRKHLNFVRSMCSWAGPNLESLTLRTRTNPANDNQGAPSHLRQLGQPLGTPPFSLRQTLKSLKVSRLAGLFSTDLGLELRGWTSLRHLALGDDLVRLGLNTAILTIHGLSTIDLQVYNTVDAPFRAVPSSFA
ncbi:hypothetical protein DL96DRAFT_837393 [Flagelloscypha sp. PMI_526]|nr:hypothetical protein DL96DRAFT_837393 [Flagelloscypha sp. PMI_526]